MSIDGLSLFASAQELNAALRGARLDKIFQPRRCDLFFALRQMGSSLLLHISAEPRFPAVFLAKTQPENPPAPPAFCMLLRKQLEGGRIVAVRHINCDRILAIDIDTIGAKNIITTKTLYLELAGKYSNVILTQDGKIIDSLKHIGANNSRVRIVLPTYPYEPPLQSGCNIFSGYADDFWALLAKMPEKSLYRAVLNSGAGFGPVTARHIIKMANLSEEETVQSLAASEKNRLKEALAQLKGDFSANAFTFNSIEDERGKIIALAPYPLAAKENEIKRTFDSMSELLSYALIKTAAYVPPEKEQLKRFVSNELSRQVKKAAKLETEIAAAEDAEAEKIKADNLMTYHYNFKDHLDSEISVTDIYSGKSLLIKLDKRLTLIENMQRYYHRYDKLRRGAKILKEQLAFCQAEAKYLKSVEASLEVSKTSAEINEIKAELIKTNYLNPSRKKTAAQPAAKPLLINLDSGAQLLIGKNNLQNDRLTFKTASPNDIWLHVKDIPGSHVILRGADDMASIEIAAQFAAFFSQAKNSSNVPVDYVRRRFVKKPAGAKPGFVIFTNNKTLFITPQEEILAKYLT